MAIAVLDHRVDVVRRRAEQWADELIDLGTRNTLLHYKDTKTTTLDLTSARPEGLANLLAGQKTRLEALFPDDDDHRGACVRARNLRRRILVFEEEQGMDVGRLARGLMQLEPPPKSGLTPVPPLRAPLLLQPVQLSARTADESDFTLEVTDEPEVNPVLLYALSRQYGIDIEEEALKERLSAMLVTVESPQEQLSQAYQTLADVIKQHKRTVSLEDRVLVGLFSFEKFPMVNDLRTSIELLASHDVIAAAAGYQAAQDALQAQAESISLLHPDRIPPSQEYLVQDADSSQQQAIHATLAGAHVVIEGPPGTGKSQTIANLIAELAARGRRVLFVAEKRAAIEAVMERLARVDLHGLVFDLHQRKLNRKRTAQQLANALQRASQEPPPQLGDLHTQLAEARERASAHAAELHMLRPPWNVSAYDAQSTLLSQTHENKSGVRFRGATLHGLSGDALTQARHDLANFVAADGLRVRRGGSPWSRVATRNIGEVEPVLTALNETRSTLQRTRDEVGALVHQAGLEPPVDPESCHQVLKLLDGVARTRAVFGEDIFSRDLSRLCFATGDRRWRARHREPDGFWNRRLQRQQVQSMRTDGQRNRQVLHKELVEALALRRQWKELAHRRGTPVSPPGLGPALERFRVLSDRLATIARCAQVREIERHPLDEITELLDQLDADRTTLLRMPQLNQLVDRLEEMGLAELLDELVALGSNPDQALRLFDRAWLTSILDELYLRVPHLRDFMGLQHSRTIDHFQAADAEHFRHNANRVRYEVATQLRQARDAHPQQNRIVLDQANRKRGHIPLRKLVQKAPDVLLAAHPCWAMSPLVVSQVLPAEQLFDVVIFDEASQIMPHDAMTSIMRGRQLVVAGDSKQLPPSTFFRRILGGEEFSDEDDDQGGDLTLYDSILDRLKKSIVPHTFVLRWHYRSRDERLIAFSNQEIYQNELVTFPGVMETAPLTLEVVDGVAAPGQDGSAPQEVTRVVQLVLEHAEQRSDENLGVIALSQKHASRIEAALRMERASRPHLDEFFSEERGAGHRFFIKNLERVQGDERDAIIFSVGHAKAANGRLSMRFGPLNEEGGERRLNVAVTRARRRMTVVSSFSHWDMAHAESAKNRGPDLLRKFLEVAHHGGDLTRLSRGTGAPLDGFEQSVHDALHAHGIEVIPQLGVSGYRIDFALPHRDRPGQLVLAVETDGRSYHSAPSTRDRDRLRQSHLEQLGWRFHRVWSTDWFRNPEQETLRIIQVWEEAMRRADEETVPRSVNRQMFSTPMSTPVRRSPRPSIPHYERIGDYTAHDLLTLCLWLLDDGLQVDRETRIGQAMKELGFQKRGKNIVERLNHAFNQAQAARDRGRN